MTLHDPEIEVTCDGEDCDAHEILHLTTTSRGYDERNIRADLEERGWVVDGDSHYCEDCAREKGLTK